MTLKRFGMILAVAVLCIFVGVSTGTAAGKFPAKDITLICPWSAGGGTDTISRALVKNAKKYFGVNVNVVNKTGGMGAVGMGAAANARPDGYTVGMITFQLSTYPTATTI
jgi:tripartite-type tricarboxylate transporter receptor subunit TctC